MTFRSETSDVSTSGWSSRPGHTVWRSMSSHASRQEVTIGLYLILIGMIIAFTILTPRFFEAQNWENLARQGTVLLLLSGGVGMVMIAGGLDLSIGSIVSVASVTTALAASAWGMPAAVVIGIASGGVIGLLNGALIAGAGIPPFIATLATLSAGGGAALLISGGVPVYDVPTDFTWLALTEVGPIPLAALFSVLVIAGLIWMMRYSRFGGRVYALGGNERAAWLSGINTRTLKCRLYVMSGMIAGLGAVFLSSRVNTGQPTLGLGLELQVIAAVLIAGVPLTGGEGSLYRIAVAAVMLTVLDNGLNLTSVPSYWQAVAIGTIIAAASLADSYRQRRSQRRPTGAGSRRRPGRPPQPDAS